MVVILAGQVSVNGSEIVSDSNTVLLSRQHNGIKLHVAQNSLVLLLSGEPINEAIVGHGPFVINTKQEILQAFKDLQGIQFVRL